ncbi:MAG TPA: carbohydrate porin [Planctomycetota bacterium]|nr:carbohydrate porin [Planctomycetota bacterium]
MKTDRRLLAAAALAAVVALSSTAARAEDPPPTPPAQTSTAPTASTPAPKPETSGQADDANSLIETARPRPAGLLKRGPVSLIDPVLDDLNARLKKSLGLEFGLAYTAVYQDPTDGSIDDAMGGDIDVFARWRLLGAENSGSRGVLGVYGENRHEYTDDMPRDLAATYGSLWRTTNNFGLQKWAMTQVWWEQHLLDDRVVGTAGKLDPTNYFNTHRYQNDATAFLSQAFSGNPARAFPGNGLGANAKVNIGKTAYASAGFQDANGDKLTSGLHSIDEGEFWYALEGGWTPNLERFGKGAYRLTLWSVEERDDAGVPSDRGIAINAEQEIGQGLVPFARIAWSDGDATGVDRFACAGLGLEGVVGTKEDLFGVGLSYGEPDGAGPDSQWGGEVFHRFQLSPDVQLTIGYQYVHSPSFDNVDGNDPVGVFELRVRIQF